jgi:hypothetical protein
MNWPDLVKLFEAEWAKQKLTLDEDVQLSRSTLKIVKLMARTHYIEGVNLGIQAAMKEAGHVPSRHAE